MSLLLLRPSERERGMGQEGKVGRDVYAYLYTGNLLHKSLAHYHIVMERHPYTSTPLLYSLCPINLSELCMHCFY